MTESNTEQIAESSQSASSPPGSSCTDAQQEAPSNPSCFIQEAAGSSGQVSVADDAAQPQQQLTPEQQAAMVEAAEKLKSEGNLLFGEGKWEEAATKYMDAIEAAPPPPLAAKQRAIYLANLAACDIKLKQFDEAIRSCTAALEEDPGYVKALMRRSSAFEEIDDLDHALADAKKVLELDAGNGWATKAAARLEPVVAERHEKLKGEMLGKLKDLGNLVLGKFGLSVDNFKAEKDPATGSYSIKFQQ